MNLNKFLLMWDVDKLTQKKQRETCYYEKYDFTYDSISPQFLIFNMNFVQDPESRSEPKAADKKSNFPEFGLLGHYQRDQEEKERSEEMVEQRCVVCGANDCSQNSTPRTKQSSPEVSYDVSQRRTGQFAKVNYYLNVVANGTFAECGGS